jgi:hypothetical protein
LGTTKPKVPDFLPLLNKCERRLGGVSSMLNKLAGCKSPMQYSQHCQHICIQWNSVKLLSNKWISLGSTVSGEAIP